MVIKHQNLSSSDIKQTIINTGKKEHLFIHICMLTWTIKSCNGTLPYLNTNAYICT